MADLRPQTPNYRRACPAEIIWAAKGGIRNRMNPNDIKTHERFEALFQIEPALLSRIEQDMSEGIYDFSQPIMLATWEGQEEPVCIDGHTRLKAALNSGVEAVSVWVREYDTEEEAIHGAIKFQRNRRNMTDAEFMACIGLLDKKRARGGDRRSDAVRSERQHCPIENGGSSSAQDTGEILGISERKVRQARTVMEHADEATKEAVRSGEKSINRAYNETQKQRKRQEAMANDKTNNPEEKGVVHPSKPETVDENEERVLKAPVLISMGHFEALHELGGSIGEHLASAIELYLNSLEEGKIKEDLEETVCEADADESEYDDEKYDDEEYED